MSATSTLSSSGQSGCLRNGNSSRKRMALRTVSGASEYLLCAFSSSSFRPRTCSVSGLWESRSFTKSSLTSFSTVTPRREARAISRSSAYILTGAGLTGRSAFDGIWCAFLCMPANSASLMPESLRSSSIRVPLVISHSPSCRNLAFSIRLGPNCSYRATPWE